MSASESSAPAVTTSKASECKTTSDNLDRKRTLQEKSIPRTRSINTGESVKSPSDERKQMPTFSSKASDNPPAAAPPPHAPNIFSTKSLSVDKMSSSEKVEEWSGAAQSNNVFSTSNVFSTRAASQLPPSDDTHFEATQLRQNSHESPPIFSSDMSACDVKRRQQNCQIVTSKSSAMESKRDESAALDQQPQSTTPIHPQTNNNDLIGSTAPQFVTSSRQTLDNVTSNIDRASLAQEDEQRFALQSEVDVRMATPSLLHQHSAQRRSLEREAAHDEDDDDVMFGDEPPRNMFSMFDERSSRLQQENSPKFPTEPSRESGE